MLARQQVLDRLLASATDAGAIANRLAFHARFDLRDDFENELVAQIAQLTLAQFQPFVASELVASSQVFGAFGNADAVDAALAGARSE